LPNGFELFEPPAEQRALDKPVFLSYHPDDAKLATEISQILNTQGVAVIKRNWGVQPTLSPSKQQDWILQNTKHMIALVSPQYTELRGQNTDLATTLLGELNACHEFAKSTGADRGVLEASYVYPLMVRNGKLNNYINNFWPTQATLSDNSNAMLRQIMMVARGITNLAV
jgi:hypothetical protein